MQEITLYVKLKASQIDGMGYTTYVFEDLNFQDYDHKYIMCVQFPNWDHGPIKEEEVGYATFKYVRGGIDEWFNGTDFVKYNYTNIVFLKFIRESAKTQIVID